ncbi:MAG: hypothetical protein ACFFEK_00570 [Candidatus Thorarchaeota archaeon]
MKDERISLEITSILALIDESREKIISEHDRFQVALTNSLRLLGDSSQTLSKMKGDTEDLKAYLIRSSITQRQTSIDLLEQLRTKIEKLDGLIQSL